jgi:SAM-dependent methyltransferase
VTFEVPADAYDQLVGAYSERLAAAFADFAGVVDDGQRVLDVGCGPGALTAVLVHRLGAAQVSAVDPSESFVRATRRRCPDADVQSGVAEDLPYPDGAFGAALAQLVVHFMDDPVAGLRELGRVTKDGGAVAACVWDHEGGRGPFTVFWTAARELDPDADDESGRAGAREGHLGELCDAAGLADIETSTLTVRRTFETFDEWWAPFTYGIGPPGGYLAGISADRREALRERCRQYLPSAPFEIAASAWAVRARA